MRKLRLLLVDDHEAFLNAAKRALRKESSWVEVVGVALNGIQAIAQCEELKPDAVLMDMAMPEMGGVQATRVIKAQDEPPFIIIASHFDDVEHRDHAKRSGADAFVSKLSYAFDTLPHLKRLHAEANNLSAPAQAE